MSSVSSSRGNIPFSWENKPGIRKSADSSNFVQLTDSNGEEMIKLPCDQDSNNITFQPPSRSCSKKGMIVRKLVNDVTEGREKPCGYSNENTFQPPLRSSFSKRTVIGKFNDAVKQREDSTREGKIKLRPPPCENFSNKVTYHDLVIPLPPCANFQPPPLRSSSRKGAIIMRKEDDPFLIAYKECTKSTKKSTSLMKKSSFLGSSCKHSCSVRDDSIVRVSQVPLSNSERRRPVSYDI